MRALHHTPEKHNGNDNHISVMKSFVNRFSNLSEGIWLSITFLLFLAMGPFSVIAVVYGLWSLASAENREKLVEPASC